MSVVVPNDATIAGLGRRELIELIRALEKRVSELEKERDEAVKTWEDHECPLLPMSFDGETR